MGNADKKISDVVRLLKEKIGKSTPIVLYSDPFKVLISTVLSQRTRDENTALASEQLFSKYKKPMDLANAKPMKIEELIRPSGFYRVKAKRIINISRAIMENFGGTTPRTMAELTSLPGVGNKTAACVMVFGFGIPEIPVDVHVAVMSNRLGLVNEKNPDKIRLELMQKLPKKHWLEINELMVKYGQRICRTRNPKCGECKLSNLCKYHAKKKQAK